MKTEIKNNNYDLEERTTVFSESVIKLYKQTPVSVITTPIISQLIRAATSIGANYAEANGASSRKDFKNKMYLCKKEAKETKYWLRILATTVENSNTKELWKEAQELTLIFSKIIQNTK